MCTLPTPFSRDVSYVPVVSIRMWSTRPLARPLQTHRKRTRCPRRELLVVPRLQCRYLLRIFLSPSTRSPRTVQQMHPLFLTHAQRGTRGDVGEGRTYMSQVSGWWGAYAHFYDRLLLLEGFRHESVIDANLAKLVLSHTHTAQQTCPTRA